MPTQLLQTAILASILASMLRLATPLLLAALGEMVAERSGVLNLGVEGMMLLSAFTSYVVTYFTGSLLLGLLVAVLTGGLMALLMAFMAVTLKVEQIVTGMALNLLGAGLSVFLLRLIFGTTGDLITIPLFNPVQIPLLSGLPLVGPVLFGQRPLTYLAFGLVPVIWFFMYRTKYGLQLRAVGESPKAVDTKGVDVARLRYLATIFGGLMAGLAGAALTLGASPRFVPGITAGRGWLAIVIVIAGNWLPWRITLAALVFALLDAFQLQVQGIGVQIPYQILLAAPYVFAIVAMMINRVRSEAPSFLGVPYQRES
jgi:general nucleoside transport system permease protein